MTGDQAGTAPGPVGILPDAGNAVTQRGGAAPDPVDAAPESGGAAPDPVDAAPESGGAAPDPVDAALAPVRAALLATAEADAAALLAEAEAAAGDVARARAQAGELVALARAEGAADAAAVLAADRARARRDARRVVLTARREAYEQLRARASAAVTALRADPGYPRLRDRLAAEAVALLGPAATIAEHPDGGVVGSVPGRRCDLSLAAVADRAVDALGPEVERLWTP